MLRRGRGIFQPERGDHAQLVAVPEDEDIAGDRAHPLDHPRGPSGDIVDGLPFGHAVTEEIPSRSLLLDLSAHLPLVRAVIPFDKIGVDGCEIVESGDRTGLSSAPERADEHGLKGQAGERVNELTRLPSPFVGQRDIGSSSVALDPAPLSFAMAHDDDALPPLGATLLHNVRAHAPGSDGCFASLGSEPITSQSRSATAALTASGSCSRWSTQKLHLSKGTSPWRMGSNRMPGFSSTPGTCCTASRPRPTRSAISAPTGRRTLTLSRRVS